MCGWSEVTEAADWQRLLALAERSALQQAWAYGAAIEMRGHAVCRLVWQQAGERSALAQLVRRRLPVGSGLALLLRGPIWLDGVASVEREASALAALARRWRQAVFVWQPDDAEAAGRRAGCRRVWTGSSTVFLDLTPPLEALRCRLHGKWRNMLRAAEAAPLRIETAAGGRHLEWLLAETERQRRERRYAAPGPDFTRNLAMSAGPSAALTLVATRAGQPVAGMLFLRHGGTATYQTGATTADGRALRAHHRLLWQAMTRLKDEGCRWLDLGLVDTVANPGIARFKLGSGAVPMTLAGSYLRPPDLWRRAHAT